MNGTGWPFRIPRQVRFDIMDIKGSVVDSFYNKGTWDVGHAECLRHPWGEGSRAGDFISSIFLPFPPSLLLFIFTSSSCSSLEAKNGEPADGMGGMGCNGMIGNAWQRSGSEWETGSTYHAGFGNIHSFFFPLSHSPSPLDCAPWSSLLSLLHFVLHSVFHAGCHRLLCVRAFWFILAPTVISI